MGTGPGPLGRFYSRRGAGVEPRDSVHGRTLHPTIISWPSRSVPAARSRVGTGLSACRDLDPIRSPEPGDHRRAPIPGRPNRASAGPPVQSRGHPGRPRDVGRTAPTGGAGPVRCDPAPDPFGRSPTPATRPHRAGSPRTGGRPAAGWADRHGRWRRPAPAMGSECEFTGHGSDPMRDGIGLSISAIMAVGREEAPRPGASPQSDGPL